MGDYDPFTTDSDPIDKAEQGQRIGPNRYKDRHSELYFALVKQFKRAICDAHMRSRHFSIDETYYLLQATPIQGYPALPVEIEPLIISRPTADGSGGGKILSSHARLNPAGWTPTFNNLRDRIDKALRGHYVLPTYTDTNTLLTATRDWAQQLNGDTSKNTGSLPSWIGSAQKRLVDSNSNTLTYVANNLLGGLTPALNILTQASFACISLINLNAHAVNILRSETRKAISSAIDACNHIRSEQTKCTLNFAITALNITATGEKIMKGDLGATKDTLTQIKGWLEAKEKTNPFKNFVYSEQDIIAAFEKAIAKIDTNFLQAEQRIRDAYISISDTLSNRYDSGDLTIDDQPQDTEGRTQVLSIDNTSLEQVYHGDLHEISKLLRKVKDETYRSNYTAAFSRWKSLGISPTGPSKNFYDVVGEIRLILERLSESCDGIASGLESFHNDIKANETDSADSIRKITRRMQEGTKTHPKFS